MKPLRWVSIIVIFAVWITILLFKTQLGRNLVCLTIFDEYAIPRSSSIFTFKPTDWFSKGSGEWWNYGEDSKNYYFWDYDSEKGYRRISKEEAAKLSGFSPTDELTWKEE